MIAIRSMTASHEHEPWGTWPDSAPHFAGCQGRRRRWGLSGLM